MTGDQSIQDLQSQVASLSGKIAQMQQSLGTGGIVMQVKSELAGEYKEIIGYSTTQVNHYQNTFWTILGVVMTVVIGILGIVGYFTKKYIDDILKSVLETETNIKTNKGFIEKQSEDMIKTQDQLNEQIQVVQQLEKDVESQDIRIYNSVMQHLVKGRFDRVKEDPQFLNKLTDQLATFDRDIVRLNLNENYEVIKDTKTTHLLYHFFADLIFRDGRIKDWIRDCEQKKRAHSYSSFMYGLNLIFLQYGLDSSLYSDLVEYLKFINERVFVKKNRAYTPEQLDSIKSKIDILTKKYEVYSTWSEIYDPFIS